MFFRILKKDLKRKKGVHIILLLFITIATIFLASSVNNILVVTNATEYYLNKANIADFYVCESKTENSNMEKWLRQESKYSDAYGASETIVSTGENLSIEKDGKKSEYDAIQTIMLQTQPEKYGKMFDEDGKIPNVKKGEVGVPYAEMEQNGLEIGDTIFINMGNYERSLKVSVMIKDAAFGGDFIGMKRLLLNESDYDYLAHNPKSMKYVNYFVATDNVEKFQEEFNQTRIPALVSGDSNMFEFTYVMNMVVAGILIVVGTCLIVIAFLVLRFTIIFTIQEDYREIGIMKAVGIKNRGIKQIYLIKYFVLVVAGAVAGCVISFPVSNIMIDRISTNMLMQNSQINWVYNVICGVIIIFTVLLICQLSTRRLNKYSAISAICGGKTGERFRKKSKWRLWHHEVIGVPWLLAWNDIFSNLKRYAVLMITFCVGTILIILPLNAINTLQSTEMATQFGLNEKANFCIDKIEGDEGAYLTGGQLSKGIQKVSEEFKEQGINAKLYVTPYYTFTYYLEDEKESELLLTTQMIGSDGAYLKYIKGEAPILANEIAITEIAMEEMNVGIGDTVYTTINDEKREFIITGQYQDFMQMGKSARLSPKFSCKDTMLSGYWYIQGELEGESRGLEIAALEKKFPKYEFYSLNEAINQQLGSSVGLFDQVKNFMVILISCINMLITVLMMKIFIAGEKGEIGMAKSIGFRTGTIRLWLTLRVISILIVAMILGILLSAGLNNVVLRPVFAMMGGRHIQIVVIPQQVYGFYPLILFVGIVAVTVFSSSGIKKIDLREINNLE